MKSFGSKPWMHKLLHQIPWYDEEGNVAGLIELAIDLPGEMPVFDRG